MVKPQTAGKPLLIGEVARRAGEVDPQSPSLTALLIGEPTGREPRTLTKKALSRCDSAFLAGSS